VQNTSATCAYCHAELDRMTAPRCFSCGANHHSDCWAENSGCAILGCSASPDAVAVTTTMDNDPPGWSASQTNGAAHATALAAPPVRSTESIAPVLETAGVADTDGFRSGWQEGYRCGWQDAYRSGWQEGRKFQAQPVSSLDGPTEAEPSAPMEGKRG
jgi:hypothetical protein